MPKLVLNINYVTFELKKINDKEAFCLTGLIFDEINPAPF